MPDDEEDVETQQSVTISADDLKNLRRLAEEAKEAQRKVETYERERAFTQAGIDLSDPKMGYFVKGYEGELSPEAIKQRAEADGFLVNGEQQAPSGPSQQEMGAHRQMANAAAGASGAPPFDMNAALAEAKTPEDIMQIMTQQGYPTTWNRPS